MSVIENNCTSTSWMWRNATGQATALTGAGGVLYERCNKVNGTTATGLPATSVSAGPCGSCNASAECFVPLTNTSAGCVTNSGASSRVCQCKTTGLGGRCIPGSSSEFARTLSSSSSAEPGTTSRSSWTGTVSTTESRHTISGSVTWLVIPSTSQSGSSVRSCSHISQSTTESFSSSPSLTTAHQPFSATASASQSMSSETLSSSASHSCPLNLITNSALLLANSFITAASGSDNASLCPGSTVGQLLALGAMDVVWDLADGVRIERIGNATTNVGRIANASAGKTLLLVDVGVVRISLMGTHLGSLTLVNDIVLEVAVDAELSGRCVFPNASHRKLSYSCALQPMLHITPLEKAIEKSFQANTIVASCIGSSVSAMSMTSVFAILGLTECTFSDIDPVDPSISPLLQPLGNALGAYYRGAVVYGLLLYASAATVLPAVLAILGLVRQRTFGADLSRCRYPSVLLLVVGVFHQGLASSGVALIRLDVSPMDSVIGVAAILVDAIVTLGVGYMTTKGLQAEQKVKAAGVDAAEENENEKVSPCTEPTVPGAVSWFLTISVWDAEWCDTAGGSGFASSYFFLLDDMKMPAWQIIELSSSLLQGAIVGLRLNDLAVCQRQKAALVCVTAAVLALALWLKPVGSRLGQWGLVVQKAGAVVVAILTLVHTVTNIEEFSDAIDYAVATLSAAGAVQTALQIITILLLSRSQLIQWFHFALQRISHNAVPVVPNEDFDSTNLLHFPLSDANDAAEEARIELEVAQSPPSTNEAIDVGFDSDALRRNRLAGCTDSFLLSIALPAATKKHSVVKVQHAVANAGATLLGSRGELEGRLPREWNGSDVEAIDSEGDQEGLFGVEDDESLERRAQLQEEVRRALSQGWS